MKTSPNPEPDTRPLLKLGQPTREIAGDALGGLAGPGRLGRVVRDAVYAFALTSLFGLVVAHGLTTAIPPAPAPINSFGPRGAPEYFPANPVEGDEAPAPVAAAGVEPRHSSR